MYTVRSIMGVPQLMTLQLSITDDCNLRCRHCYSEDYEKNAMTLGQFCQVCCEYFSFIKKHRMKGYIKLTGGEPLLNKHFFTMIEFLYREYFINDWPFEISILTNGMLIDETFARNIMKYRTMINEIQISIDGMEQTHDSIRGQGCFKQCLRAIRLLSRYDINVSVSCVVSKMNVNDIEQVINLCKEEKVTRVAVSRLIPLGHNEQEMRDQVLEKQEYKKLMIKLYQAAQELIQNIEGGHGVTYLQMQRCDLWHLADEQKAIDEWLNVSIENYKIMGTSCLAGFNQINILTNGDITPCRRYPEVIGNIFADSLSRVWTGSTTLRNFRNRQHQIKGKCAQCKFNTDPKLRMLCSGGAVCLAAALGGSIYDPDPLCWREVEGDEKC